MKNRIGVIIAAAGVGKRFGQPKALAEIGDEIFLTVILKTLSKSIFIMDLDIVAIVNDEVASEIGNRPFTRKFIVNNELEKGMLHSVFLGYKHLSDYDFYLIFPVDHPLVRSETIDKIISNAKIDELIIPNFEGKKGHPILIPKSIMEQIDFCSGLPLNVILRGFDKKIIQTNDDKILCNINFRNDLN